MRTPVTARRATAAAASLLTAAATLLIAGCAAPKAHDGAGHPGASLRSGPRRAPAAHLTPGTQRKATTYHLAARPARHVGTPDARLAAALAPILRHDPGDLAVGVTDQATGATATYHPTQAFDTASIVKADILAVLLLQHQQIGTPLSTSEQQLAAAMIDASDNTAATDLWDAVEAAPGMEAGNAALGLHRTVTNPYGAWGLTTTTVIDQLRLLTDLTTTRSPLTASARQYELGLMRDVEPGQNWGVTAAASPGTHPAVKNGWLPVSPYGAWMINSIGVITHDHQQLTIAVLSGGQPTEAAGISRVQAAAKAAASAITATG